MKMTLSFRPKLMLGSALRLAGLCATTAQPIQPEVLVNFNGTNGANPWAGLTQVSDGSFYGTTYAGTAFKITTNGVLTTLALLGGNSYAGLTLGNDGDLYGTTVDGGSHNQGSVFRVTTDGMWTNLFSFGGTPSAGRFPKAGLTLGADNSFYGTTYQGGGYGPSYFGTVFNVTTNGTLTKLATFTGDGAYPWAGLTLGNDGNFYGTTTGSGIYPDAGSVFQVSTNGTLSTLFRFRWGNGDGEYPYAGLTLGNDGSFYGTTQGASDYGNVFKVTASGAFTKLVNFNFTNGSAPIASLALGNDGNFYGTTTGGGSSSHGTVFQMTTNGTLTKLADFTGSNGANPGAGLTLGSDGNFYGTTTYGGSNNLGVIFRLNRGVYIQSFEMTNNGFQLSAINVGGSGTVVLDASTDLSNWTPILTNPPNVVPVQFLDPAATSKPQQFYRMRQQ